MYYAVKVSWNKVPYPVLSVNDCIPSFAGQHAAKETMIINRTSDSVTCPYAGIPPSWTVYPIPKLFQTMLHRDCSSISASIIHLCKSVTWLCPFSVLFRWFDCVFARLKTGSQCSITLVPCSVASKQGLYEAEVDFKFLQQILFRFVTKNY